jgi:hypothetical protein
LVLLLQELERQCNTLLGMIEKEAEVKQQEEEINAKGGPMGKVSFNHNPLVNLRLIVL